MVVNEATKFILISAVLAVGVSSEGDRVLVRLPRQNHGKNGQHDQSSAETGFLGGGGVENSKYFHYQHLPEHDKYEFGHRRGNDHHVIERYEKAIPHDGQFKTKVRWADKKGGHGEHYWDYNHAGHGGNGGQNDGDGGYSDSVAIYQQKGAKQHHKRHLGSEKKIGAEDEEVPSPTLNSQQQQQQQQTAENRPEQLKKFEEEISQIQDYDIQKQSEKQKRAPLSTGEEEKLPVTATSDLFFDVKSGKVIDESTGKKYILQPIN